MANTEFANQLLNQMVDDFKNNKVVETIVKMPLIKDPNDDRECWNWSQKNRYLMVGQRTFDARNFNAWKRIGRFPLNPAKKVFIMKPMFAFEHNENNCDGNLKYSKGKGFICQKCKKVVNKEQGLKNKTVVQKIIGYAHAVEFAVENTYGRKLPEYTPSEKPKLFGLAKLWDIKIKYQVDPSLNSYGHTNAQTDKKQEIVLGTEAKNVFYHELAHQADKRTQGKNLKGGQDPMQEIIAEMTSSVLTKMYENIDTEYHAYNYVQEYAKKMKLPIEKAVDRVLSRLVKVIEYIVTEADKLEKQEKQLPMKIEKPQLPMVITN